MRILIADDETIIRLDLRGLLEAAGYEVREARDGAEAVDLAQAWNPDLAVLDARMPGLDGIEAARRINANRPVPVILLTAYSDRGTIERAIGAGIFAYLVKPFSESDLVPAIELAWGRHADWLESRRELGRRPLPGPQTVDVVVEGTHRYPLRIERRLDGTVDVSLSEDR
jgi:two-component system, response regulator PdtaR